MAEKWIQKAIKHPGALHATAKKAGAVKDDGTIKKDWIKKKAKGGGKTAKRARLAMTLSKMKHENVSVLEFYLNNKEKKKNLNESVTGIIAMFIAGSITGVALYNWARKRLSQSCGQFDPKSSEYALCMSRKYERLAQEFDTRSKTDCSHFDNKDGCTRRLEDVADNFHSLTSKWRVKYKERAEDEKEEEVRRRQRQKDFERKVKMANRKA